MKKLLVLLLTILMIFTFTACGKITASCKAVSVTVSGQNSKKLTITLKGDIGSYDRTLSYMGKDGGEKYFDIVEKSAKAKKVTYTVTAWQAGMSTFSIFIKDGNTDIATVVGYISVDSNLKMQCVNLEAYGEEYVDLGKEDKSVQIPVRDGQNQFIYIQQNGGEWEAFEYPLDMMTVSYISEVDSYDYFMIEALKEGTADVMFLNKTLEKKLVVNYSIKADSSGALIITANDYAYSPYTIKDEAIHQGEEAKLNVISILEPTLTFSDEYAIEGVSLYKFKNGESYTFEDPASFTYNDIPEGYDSFSVEAYKGDMQFEYLRTTGTTLAKEKSYINQLKQTVNTEEINYNEKIVTFYELETGIKVALWEQDGTVYRITFMSGDKAGDVAREILDELLLS